MAEQTKLLIELLNEGRTCNEICNILNISNKQLYNNLTNLKKKGILVLRKYFETGDIVYKSVNSKDLLNNNSETEIVTSINSKVIKVLVLSDLHFGNSKERIDLINDAFDYCVKNNIHLIFCCGDLIDGTYSHGEQKIKNSYSQVDYFIKKYPHDDNILTFGVGGDHDLSVLVNYNQDLLEAINNYRHDIIVPSYNNTIIKIKNTRMLLHHYIQKDTIPNNCVINFLGHSHKYTVSYSKNGQISVRVPSISDINVQSYDVLPTLFEANFYYNKDNLEMVKFIQLYFNNKFYVLNEMNYEIIDILNNNEKGVVKSLDQISKFYDRYKK